MPKKDDAVATSTPGAISAYVDKYGSAAGFENVTQDDFAIPFIGILQPMSPQVNDGVDGAKPGRLVNSVTGEFADSLLFIPAYTTQEFLEWKPRESGGGLVDRHAPNSPVVQAAKDTAESFNSLTHNGNTLEQTYAMYGLLLDAADDEAPSGMAVITFTSTKIKVYKQLMYRLRMAMVDTPNGKTCPPLFSHRLLIETTKQQNSKGTFWNYDIKYALGSMTESLVQHEGLMDAAYQLAEQVKGGVAKVNYEAAPRATGEGSADADEVF